MSKFKMMIDYILWGVGEIMECIFCNYDNLKIIAKNELAFAKGKAMNLY